MRQNWNKELLRIPGNTVESSQMQQNQVSYFPPIFFFSNQSINQLINQSIIGIKKRNNLIEFLQLEKFSLKIQLPVRGLSLIQNHILWLLINSEFGTKRQWLSPEAKPAPPQQIFLVENK